jgi:hypothetical protein
VPPPSSFGETLFDDPGLVDTMGLSSFDRFLGWVFILGMLTLLLSMVFLIVVGYDPWVIAWLTVVTGSVIGMTAGMVVMIKSFNVDNGEEASS